MLYNIYNNNNALLNKLEQWNTLFYYSFNHRDDMLELLSNFVLEKNDAYCRGIHLFVFGENVCENCSDSWPTTMTLIITDTFTYM